MTRRLRMKRVRWAALAASVVVVIGGLMVFFRPGFPIGESIAVAHVHRADAGVRVVATNRGSIPVPVSTGSELLEGYRVLTEDGQVSFDLSEGGSVRLSTQTIVQIRAGPEVELIRGALYFDSHDMTRAAEQFLVRTTVGVVRHTGTQFAARQVQGAVQVTVREGTVALERGSERMVVSAGERVFLPETGGRVRRETVARYGDEWNWVDRMTPAFDIDGNNLHDYLIWFARQTGYMLEFETAEAEQIARTTILHGSIDMEPLPMLSAVMATTDLEHTLLEGTLHISVP